MPIKFMQNCEKDVLVLYMYMFSNTRKICLLSIDEPKKKDNRSVYVLGGPFIPLCGYKPKKEEEGNEFLYLKKKKNE